MERGVGVPDRRKLEYLGEWVGYLGEWVDVYLGVG